MWGHFLAVFAAILSVGMIVGTLQWVHPQVAAQLYTSTMTSHSDGSAPVGFLNTYDITNAANAPSGAAFIAKGASDFIVSLGREGSRWAHHSHFEATIWATVIVIILVLVLGYHFFQSY